MTIMKQLIETMIGDYLEENNTSLDQFSDSDDIIKAILKDGSVKEKLKKLRYKNSDLYFDDVDLVLYDKTIAKNLLGRSGWDHKTTINDLVKKITSLPEPKKSGSGTGNTAGDMQYSKESDTRVVFSVNDEDANKLKKKHDAKKGIKVRIMKRKNGNKVYIDTKNLETMNNFLNNL